MDVVFINVTSIDSLWVSVFSATEDAPAKIIGYKAVCAGFCSGFDSGVGFALGLVAGLGLDGAGVTGGDGGNIPRGVEGPPEGEPPDPFGSSTYCHGASVSGFICPGAFIPRYVRIVASITKGINLLGKVSSIHQKFHIG